MNLRLPTKVNATQYDRAELELWQTGCIVGAMLGFSLGVLVTGLIALVAWGLI